MKFGMLYVRRIVVAETDNKKSKDFNIYFLNFSKVYEIAMMINNVILTKIETDNSNTFEEQYGFTSSISAQRNIGDFRQGNDRQL